MMLVGAPRICQEAPRSGLFSESGGRSGNELLLRPEDVVVGTMVSDACTQETMRF